ncbi:CRP-like cAMP-activated global transcriptional regulator [bioreactor metagenome]|uniref:CRP-like cAMP-activated global transcriptional regulator n=1 Tax=bioreactor metagenome TaxID=1076179 RepID=A0A645F9Z4_9ZZZZ
MPLYEAPLPAKEAGLPQNVWQPLARGRRPTVYAPGQTIYAQGTEATRFYYILDGKAKAFLTSPSGDERVLTYYRQGDLMGEAAFFDGEQRVTSAVALTRCRIVDIDREEIRGIFAAQPQLAMDMLKYLAHKVRLLSGHVDDISFLAADRRVARFLLTLHAETGETLRCTQDEIGFAAGASRVTVSRILGEFSRQGWLRTGYRRLELLNPKALEQFALAE